MTEIIELALNPIGPFDAMKQIIPQAVYDDQKALEHLNWVVRRTGNKSLRHGSVIVVPEVLRIPAKADSDSD